MKPVALALLLGLPLVQPAAAAGHRLECPAVAPADWALPHARLSAVAVLAAKDGEAIDEASPPTLVPDSETISAGSLHQRWQMNVYGPGSHFYVDCRYQGSDRVLRLDAAPVKICERVVTKFNRATGASPQSQNRLYCD
jgi:hypothetical protein